jgi:hypothetical protein
VPSVFFLCQFCASYVPLSLRVLALYELIVERGLESLQVILTGRIGQFARLAWMILIVDGASYSCSRIRGEAEAWQGFFSSAIILETNELPQKSELLQISDTPGADDQVKA